MSFFQVEARVEERDKTNTSVADMTSQVKIYKMSLSRSKRSYEQQLAKSNANLEKYSTENKRKMAMLAMRAANTAQKRIDAVNINIDKMETLLMDLQGMKDVQLGAQLQQKMNHAFADVKMSINVKQIRNTAQKLEMNRESLHQTGTMVDDTNDSLMDSILADDEDGDGADESLEEQYEQYLSMQIAKSMMDEKSAESKTKIKTPISKVLDELFPPEESSKQ
jgi:hypothetical protein